MSENWICLLESIVSHKSSGRGLVNGVVCARFRQYADGRIGTLVAEVVNVSGGVGAEDGGVPTESIGLTKAKSFASAETVDSSATPKH